MTERSFLVERTSNEAISPEPRHESGAFEVLDDDDRLTIPDLGPAGLGWEGAPIHDTIPAPPGPGFECSDVLRAVDEVLQDRNAERD